MTEKDELQDLWQSHVATAHDLTVPNFSLMEDMTAPVQSAAELKWLNIMALLFVMLRVLVEFQRVRSTPEFVACCVAIIFAVVGVVLLLRQRRRAIVTGGHDCSVEEFRIRTAQEYERQTRSFRRSFVPALLLSWAALLSSESLRSYDEHGTSAGALIPPALLVLAIPFAIRFQRSMDERGVRRILRGY
jgi:hypothetical protein